MKRALSLLFLIATFTLPAQADQIAGAEIPDRIEAEGTELLLNGAGVRKKFMMSIYVGALYLQKKSADATAITAADEVMAIKLQMVSGLISSEKMQKATEEGFENATGGKTEPIRKEIDAFIDVFREEITETDLFDILYVPGKGVDVHKNGAYKATIGGGLPFKRALFGIWISEHPAQKSLKEAMLGG